MQITKKKIIILLLLSVSIFVLYSIIFSEKQTLTYEYAKISKGRVAKTISTTGELIVKEELINSKIEGVISSIRVKVNHKVKKGQYLFSIRSEGLDSQLKRLRNSLESIKLKVELAAKQYEAKKNMHMENLISKEGLRTAEISYKTVLLQERDVRLNYSIALKNKKNTRIYSPVSGIVMLINVKNEQPVGVNTNLMKIAVNIKKMTLAIRIDESDIGYVKEKQPVNFSVSAFPDAIFKGIIRLVHMNPEKVGGLVTYRSIVSCDNKLLKLKPGMTATANVLVGVKKNVLRVPNQSFIVSPFKNNNFDELNIIWIKKGLNLSSIPKKTEVSVGLRGDLFTELKKQDKDEYELNDKVLIRAIIEDE